MSRQVSFFLLPSDLVSLEAKIARIGPFAVLHSRSSSKEVRKLSALDPERAGEDWLHLFLVRPEDLDRVVTQHVAVQGYWVVDVLRSPVIEFQRCFFDGKQLRRGRAYFVDKYYDSSGALIQKPETFRKWAQSVLRAIRQSLERKGSDYIGYDAKQWLSTGKGALID